MPQLANQPQQRRLPTLVPAYGLSVVPEPKEEDATPMDKMAEGVALTSMLHVLQVPAAMSEIIEAAHHVVETADEVLVGDAAPAPNRLQQLQSAFRSSEKPQDRLTPRRSARMRMM